MNARIQISVCRKCNTALRPDEEFMEHCDICLPVVEEAMIREFSKMKLPVIQVKPDKRLINNPGLREISTLSVAHTV